MNFKSSSKIPSANSFVNPIKTGILLKRSTKRLFRKSWQRRYCVIHDYKLYYYEHQDSKGEDKHSGLINLRYYDSCVSSNNLDDKATHLFIIHQSDKLGFFDGKYIFATDCETDKNEWIACIKKLLLELVKTNNAGNVQSDIKKDSRRSITLDKVISEEQRLKPVTKDRAKGPKGRRLPNRKSEFPNNNESVDGDSNNLMPRIGADLESISDGDEDSKTIEFMDEGKEQEEERIYKYSSSEGSVSKKNSTGEVETDVCNNIPDVNNERESATEVVRDSDAAMTLMKELEHKWASENEGNKKDKNLELESEINTIAVSPVQTRQISVTSNKSSRSSDQTSTYQLYLLDKDIRSLKRDVNTIQAQNNNSATRARMDSMENKMVAMQHDIDTLRTVSVH